MWEGNDLHGSIYWKGSFAKEPVQIQGSFGPKKHDDSSSLHVTICHPIRIRNVQEITLARVCQNTDVDVDFKIYTYIYIYSYIFVCAHTHTQTKHIYACIYT